MHRRASARAGHEHDASRIFRSITFNSTYVIVGTPDGARGSSYMMQVERRTEKGPVEVTLFGKYEDKFVKTRDGWRFKERIWTPDTFRGSNIPVAPSPVPGAQ